MYSSYVRTYMFIEIFNRLEIVNTTFNLSINIIKTDSKSRGQEEAGRT